MPNKKKKTKKLTAALAKCHISTPNETKSVKNVEQQKNTGESLVYGDKLEPEFCAQWPTPSLKVPYIFLHKPVDFVKHVRKLLVKEISFYHPVLGRYSTKISCPSFEDYKAIIQYFDKNKLPYHTFGHPSKRKMKVVIRGFTKDVDINELKSELKGGSIPIVRIHKMQKRKNAKDDKKPLIMVVVPNDDEGRKLLLVKQIFGFDIKMEPVKSKTKQCYRCQMWGHSQRYCHGEIKCVKCAGSHLSKKCDRDPKDPVKCANCGEEGHVASWRNCPCCPDSFTHKLTQEYKKITKLQPSSRPVLVTMKTCSTLYKNVEYCDQDIYNTELAKMDVRLPRSAIF